MNKGRVDDSSWPVGIRFMNINTHPGAFVKHLTLNSLSPDQSKPGSMKLLALSALWVLIGAVYGRTAPYEKYLKHPAEQNLKDELYDCPTPHPLTRVCNVFSENPCFCGSSFTRMILNFYKVPDEWFCPPHPFPETIAFRLRIHDSAMPYKHFEANLLTIFGTSRLDNDTVETNVTKLAETIKITSARCGNHSTPYNIVTVALPGNYNNVKIPNPTYYALEELGYDMVAMLTNKVLRIVRIRLLRKNAVPVIVEQLSYLNNTNDDSVIKPFKIPELKRPDVFIERGPPPNHLFKGCILALSGILALVALFKACYDLARKREEYHED
uniref:Recep_L_domain domain-containing protein n=1 Tax=Panagrellus redivivus TaxID=6233 RepID=A0A7E4VUT7_PANRE